MSVTQQNVLAVLWLADSANTGSFQLMPPRDLNAVLRRTGAQRAESGRELRRWEDGKMSLPETVTTLRCPNGSVVHIVGTVHFSKESVQDVRTTIAATKPQVYADYDVF